MTSTEPLINRITQLFENRLSSVLNTVILMLEAKDFTSRSCTSFVIKGLTALSLILSSLRIAQI